MMKVGRIVLARRDGKRKEKEAGTSMFLEKARGEGGHIDWRET